MCQYYCVVCAKPGIFADDMSHSAVCISLFGTKGSHSLRPDMVGHVRNFRLMGEGGGGQHMDWLHAFVENVQRT